MPFTTLNGVFKKGEPRDTGSPPVLWSQSQLPRGRRVAPWVPCADAAGVHELWFELCVPLVRGPGRLHDAEDSAGLSRTPQQQARPRGYEGTGHGEMGGRDGDSHWNKKDGKGI